MRIFIDQDFGVADAFGHILGGCGLDWRICRGIGGRGLGRRGCLRGLLHLLGALHSLLGQLQRHGRRLEFERGFGRVEGWRLRLGRPCGGQTAGQHQCNQNECNQPPTTLGRM